MLKAKPSVNKLAEIFLVELDKLLLWGELQKLIARYYTKSLRSRKPYP